MRHWIVLLFAPIISVSAWGFAATNDQAAVSVRFESPERNELVVEGQTYVLRLDNRAFLKTFTVGNFELFNQYTLTPTLNKGSIQGPGRFNIYSFGTQMYEVHLRDLYHPDLKADMEIVLYCYAKRVYVNVVVHPKEAKGEFELGWVGGAKFALVMPPNEEQLRVQLESFKGETPPALAIVVSPQDVTGKKIPNTIHQRPGLILQTGHKRTSAPDTHWTDTMIFLAGESFDDLLHLVRNEMYAQAINIEAKGGVFNGYAHRKGFYDVTTMFRGPQEFEDACVNPNQRIRVDLTASKAASIPEWQAPVDIICNVHNSYGTLEAAVVTDKDGYPLPVQVQVCKNFGSEFEEGKEEGDKTYGEAYVPLTITNDKPFEGRVYHLFGNWGTHPLKQISSIRFYHHYFHASLGPTETFCYVPFEYPRDDDRNYILADVRGLSNTMWAEQPQHDHVSVIGGLRYKSGGKWINNLLQDTRIYLTSPNLANFALDYLTEDKKIKTTLEIVEAPQDDEARSFIKMVLDVLEPVDIDETSAHNLRFVNAGAYIVKTVWPHVAYTNAEGETTTVDVPANETWALEGVPLGPQWPFAAAYSHKNGNIAFFVNRFEGVLGGKQVSSFGLSSYGGKEWTELFLTAPGSLTRLEKGDHIEAHFFVMPYGNADTDYKPAEKQRELYGNNLATIEVTHGTAVPGFPRRLKADSRGFAEFTLKNGDNWTPILVEGFSSHRGPMLWEERGGKWLFHDQQIYGNDWYQSYVDQDGKVGFVFVVKVRPGQTHHYVVTAVPEAKSITQRNGFVTIVGGPMNFVSPVKFSDLTCSPLEGTTLFQCQGKPESAVSQ
ncbi:MAG: hypothetical protein K1Y02_01340 [Candidatus Hydrogenedentes bacterium]|nr:hypothetical protein [Candidatus Hydrogenedentota bacterium]